MTRENRKNASPKFTVIITGYNRKDYILQAIESVLNQTLDNSFYQILVVSNFELKSLSTDQDIEKQNKCEFLFLENGTLGEFLTEAVIHSRGELIAFLDDDDIFSEDKLERIKNIFDEYPELGYCHNSAHVFRNECDLPEKNRNLESQTSLDFVSPHDPLKKISKFIRSGGCFNLSSISIRRNVILPFLGALSQIEIDLDTFMFMITFQNGSMAASDPSKLTYYRKHASTSFPVQEVGDKILVKYWLFEKVYYTNLGLLNILSDEKLREVILRDLLKIETIFSFHSDKRGNIKSNFRFLGRVLVDLDIYYLFLFLVAITENKRFFFQNAASLVSSVV